MLGWFTRKPLLDDDSVAWVLDSAEWLLRQVDQGYLADSAVLVLPTNAFFPGRESSAAGMAQLIFEQVQGYAGLGHWSCKAVADPQRGGEPGPGSWPPADLAEPNEAGDSAPAFLIPYPAGLVGDPQALIAYFSHALCERLCQTAPEHRPGDQALWPVISELLAVLRGFGVMIANSAFTFKRGCGGCRTTGRLAYLSQDEAVFALALFCELKSVPDTQVTPHLKSHLRPLFKRARRDFQKRNHSQGLLKSLHV